MILAAFTEFEFNVRVSGFSFDTPCLHVLLEMPSLVNILSTFLRFARYFCSSGHFTISHRACVETPVNVVGVAGRPIAGPVLPDGIRTHDSSMQDRSVLSQGRNRQPHT